jgi:DNA-binding NarL/FixJ family response regulator
MRPAPLGLIDCGAGPSIVSSADDALAAAAARRPDTVLMDIRIKGARDGIEAPAALRERFGIPVVFLTVHSDDATIERAKRSEPQSYLLKPIHARVSPSPSERPA